MDVLQNTQERAYTTISGLSDFSGGAPILQDFPNDGLTIGEDKVVPDHLDFANRTFEFFPEVLNVDYIPYGPSNFGTKMWNIWQLFKSSKVLSNMLDYYEGVTYDSIQFRFTLSNPKGISGSVVVGGGPHVNWFGVPFGQYETKYSQNNMTIQSLMLAPEAHLMSFSEAKDVIFTLPWQSNTSYWPTQAILNYSGSSDSNNLWPGVPVTFCQSLSAEYVSSVTDSARLRMFITFTGLRWLGPRVLTTSLAKAKFVRQSGLEPAAMVAMVDAAAVVGSEILSNAFEASRSSFDHEGESVGTYDAPQAVQMSYVGDSTSVGAPPVSPIFRSWMDNPRLDHEVLDFLKRPQWIGSHLTGQSKTYYANPVAPLGLSGLNGSNQQCTYFRFFSKVNSYWRGTIKIHFVIMAHPAVEVSYNLRIVYPPFSTSTTSQMSQNSVYTGIVSGVRHIVVPMPYLTVLDHLPILDNKATTLSEFLAVTPSGVIGNFEVVSTMLDVQPVIPVEVFISAGDDFEFLQPRPVGFSEVENAVFVEQIGIPWEPDVFETRAKVQNSTHTLVPCRKIEDYCKIWSRAIPYSSYDSNDEPIPTVQAGVTPCWFPMEGAGAAYTLDVNNSWFVTNDFVSFLSSLFLYYRGSIAFKIVANPRRTVTGDFLYLSLSSGIARQPANNPYTYDNYQLPPSANFGFGTVVTPFNLQPVLEVTIPQRSYTRWSLCNPRQLDAASAWSTYNPDRFPGSVTTNVVLQEPSADLQDALYRKVGCDYALAVETWIPPPTLWVASGWDWS